MIKIKAFSTENCSLKKKQTNINGSVTTKYDNISDNGHKKKKVKLHVAGLLKVLKVSSVPNLFQHIRRAR